jgi:hypothetical protein
LLRCNFSIWYSAFDGTTWSKQAKVPGAQTSGDPALAAYDGRLYLLWAGDGDDKARYSAFNGTSWTKQATIPASLISSGGGGALAVYGTQLVATWAGYSTGSSNGLDYATFDGTAWTKPQLAKGPSGTLPGPDYDPSAALNSATLYEGWVVSTGSTTGTIDLSTFDGSSWTDPTPGPSVTFSPLGGVALAAYGGQLVCAWAAPRNFDQETHLGSAPIAYASGP